VRELERPNVEEHITHGPEGLKFAHAITLLAIGTFLGQLYQLILRSLYSTTSANPTLPNEYHLYSELGAMLWYLLIVALVTIDIRKKDLDVRTLLNIDFSCVLVFWKPILKYSGGCAIAVLALALLTKETGSGLTSQTTSVLSLLFLVTVIVAPICEETVFRGYLYSSMFGTFKRERERLVVNAMLFSGAHVFFGAFLLGAEIPYYIFVLGYLVARLYEDSRSILPGILLHSFNNGLVFLIDAG